jgi:hypothetical protein
LGGDSGGEMARREGLELAEEEEEVRKAGRRPSVGRLTKFYFFQAQLLISFYMFFLLVLKNVLLLYPLLLRVFHFYCIST